MENKNILLKILSIIGSISLTISFVILAIIPTATGYEISIYDAYPLYFWCFIILTMACGIYILVHLTFAKRKSKLWLVGFFFIFLTNYIVLILPFLRGYVFYGRSDALSHLGMTIDILSTNHIGESNFYPLSHIFVSITSLISDLELTKVFLITFPIFYLVYFMGIFLLAKVITKSFGQILLIITFAILPSIGIYTGIEYRPISLSLLLIPFILYFYIRKIRTESPRYTILFIILIISCVFLHPFIALLLIFVFLIHGFSELKFKYKSSEKIIKPRIFNTILIIIITFFTWISSFILFESRLKGLYYWSSRTKYSYTGKYLSNVEKTGFTSYEFILLFFKMYGITLIYLVFFTIAVLIVIKKVFFNRKFLHKEEIFFTLFSMFTGAIFISFLIAGFNIFGHPTRLLPLVLIGCSILNGLVLYEWISKRESNSKKISIFLVTSILILSSILGVFIVHSSPYIKTPNQAVSYTEFSGGEWLAENGNIKTKIIPIASQFAWRMRDATLGFEEGTEGRIGQPPLHLGYDTNNSIANAFEEEVYIIITDYDKRNYIEIWPTQGSFNTSDFKKINDDPTANLIYTNGEFTTYHIGGI